MRKTIPKDAKRKQIALPSFIPILLTLVSIIIASGSLYYNMHSKISEQAEKISTLQKDSHAQQNIIEDYKKTISGIRFTSPGSGQVNLSEIGTNSENRFKLQDYTSHADGKFFLRLPHSLHDWQYDQQNLWDILSFRDPGLVDTVDPENYLTQVKCDHWHLGCGAATFGSDIFVVSFEKDKSLQLLEGFQKHIAFIRAISDFRKEASSNPGTISPDNLIPKINSLAKKYESDYDKGIADTSKIDVLLSVFISLLQEELLFSTTYKGNFKILSIERTQDALYCQTMMEIVWKYKLDNGELAETRMSMINQMVIVNSKTSCTLIRTTHATYKDKSDNFIDADNCNQKHVADSEFLQNIKVALDR
ncbi:hypothetical protein [Fundidesulfovibrio soli]|uniref:hypothetical protein n=1 Tax=Fundidesulfovibrio soli TaxID=2922716 RepID=UPI001FAEE277|nr:hypothetical protein [Fundidesulfovibrio soli]